MSLTPEQFQRNQRIIADKQPLVRLFNNPDFQYWKKEFFDTKLEELKNEVMKADLSTEEGRYSAIGSQQAYKALLKMGDNLFENALLGVKTAQEQMKQ